jgi:hypothetical protein
MRVRSSAICLRCSLDALPIPLASVPNSSFSQPAVSKRVLIEHHGRVSSFGGFAVKASFPQHLVLLVIRVLPAREFFAIFVEP